MSRKEDDTLSIDSDHSADERYSSGYTSGRNGQEIGGGVNTENRAENLQREFQQLLNRTEHLMHDMRVLESKQGSLRIGYNDLSTKAEIAREELEEFLDVLDAVDLKMKETLKANSKGKPNIEKIINESLSLPPPSFNKALSPAASSDRLDRAGRVSPALLNDRLERYSDGIGDNLSDDEEILDDDDY